jgi:hypothetical protein
MPFDPISGAEQIVNTVLGRVLPDKGARDAATANLDLTSLQGDIAQVLGQISVDKTEAGSQSVFVAGWRPYIGWILGTALGYGLVLQPFIVLGLVVFHNTFDPAKLPVLDAKTVLELLGAMLGFGAFRTIDKATGTGNGH